MFDRRPSKRLCKKVETEKINIETMKQEIEDDNMTRNRLKEEDMIKPNSYQRKVLDKVYNNDIKT